MAPECRLRMHLPQPIGDNDMPNTTIHTNHYTSGTPFFVATCTDEAHDGTVLLNSGHHYATVEGAQRMVDLHVAQRHVDNTMNR